MLRPRNANCGNGRISLGFHFKLVPPSEVLLPYCHARILDRAQYHCLATWYLLGLSQACCHSDVSDHWPAGRNPLCTLHLVSTSKRGEFGIAARVKYQVIVALATLRGFYVFVSRGLLANSRTSAKRQALSRANGDSKETLSVDFL